MILLFFACFFLVPAAGIPLGWKRVHDAHPDEVIELIFAMKQTNLSWLEERFWAVSDPRSPDYGRYITFDEIAEIVKAEDDAVAKVTQTLFRSNVRRVKASKGNCFLTTQMNIAAANDIFRTTFGTYVHIHMESPEAPVAVHKAVAYTIPDAFTSSVDFISGIDNFPSLTLKPTLLRQTSSLSTTPKTIASRYNISGYEATNAGNSQAIASFLNQYFSPSDLKKFQKRFDIPDVPIAKIVGDNNAEKPGVEATLDVQYITSVAKNVATWFVYTPGLVNHGQEDFLTWIIGQTNTNDSPWVHSVSYGDVESSIPAAFKRSVDNEFMKFGVSGRTILYASGDNGVGCHDGKFSPNWPASSPYITSVGGTAEGSNGETAWSDGGGGFSNFFSMPEYQKEAVQKYLNSGKAPASHYFNSSGRAYPDVSAFATNFEILYDGVYIGVDGTSCAAPTTAGIISLLNDVRLNKGKPTLGFLNPLIYQLAGKGFQDVVKGRNSHEICPGFEATEGWDPASGWGSLNFGLLNLLVK